MVAWTTAKATTMISAFYNDIEVDDTEADGVDNGGKKAANVDNGETDTLGWCTLCVGADEAVVLTGSNVDR